MHCVAEYIAADAEDARPDDAAGRVVKKERAPAVMVHAREQGREDAQDRDEAPEKDDLGAMAREHVLTEGKTPVIETDQGAVALDQRQPVAPADHEADIVADDRAGGRHHDDVNNIELTGHAGEDRREHERRLAGQRHARAFEHHDEKDRIEPVLRDDRLDPDVQHRSA